MNLGDYVKPVVDSLIYSLLGTIILLLCFFIISKALPFSMHKELVEDENTSLGIILGAFIIAIAIIVSTAIR